jgi:hypothetical protein
MKKWFRLLCIICLISGFETPYAQDASVRQSVDNINSLLRENPYFDTFNEITFYYSIDITDKDELVVNMSFNGPFKTSMKVSIHDLDPVIRIDTALEGTSLICWNCKPDSSSRPAKCIYNVTIPDDGEKESHLSDNICVMFSRKPEIRSKLIRSFQDLFRKVIEQ